MSATKVMMVGGGAREHCIASKQVNDGAELYTIMKNKNPGLARLSKEYHLLAETEVQKVAEWARGRNIQMAVIGPEAPLEKGIVDELAKTGIPSIGPTKSCARLETSKSFTRNLLEKHGIPGNPKFKVFRSLEGVGGFLAELGEFVIKDEGLCGGKGVKLSGEHLWSLKEGEDYAAQCIQKSGAVVIEEKFVGEEFSLQCLSDGKNVIGSPLAQDHKRAFEGDKGPNTGGMGSYSDANHLLPFLSQDDHDTALDITKKVCHALNDECGHEYKGVMYGGFVATKDGVRLGEFNARYADPAGVNILPLLESSLLDMFQAVIDGDLRQDMARFSNLATVCKYVVPKGYGIKSEAGFPLEVDEQGIVNAGAKYFYAAVNEDQGKLFTTSSRSVGIVGIGANLSEAEQKAESALGYVKGNVFMRHDIGTPEAIERKMVRMIGIRGGLSD